MKGRLRRRVAALWNETDSTGIELLSGALSASFGVLLIKEGHKANALEHGYFFAALCLLAATLKLVGVVIENAPVRVLGLLVGVIFWVTLAGVFVTTVPGSITWLCFAILAGAQLWAVKRVIQGRVRRGR